MKSDTFHATRLFGKTFWLTLILFFVFGGVAEWFTRLEIFQAPLTPPKMGSRHYQLGHKLTLLNAAIRNNGPVECIAVGSSMVDVGFDPDSFENGYRKVTGRDIQCFDFGIDASSAVSAAALAGLLVEDYHPRLLIFGTDARDYAVPSVDPDPAVILDSPWMKYRQGNLSLEGWLLDHSYLYRYRQHLGRLARFQFKDTLWSETQLNFPSLPNGSTPLSKVGSYINDPPDPEDDSYEVTYYTRIYSNYQMLDENLAALERIMAFNTPATQVIIVEMPVSDGLYYLFGNGETDYNRFVARVSELASLHQVPFWRTEPMDSIPDEGWADYSHMNVTGARIFSIWLGQQVGTAEVQGSFHVSVP